MEKTYEERDPPRETQETSHPQTYLHVAFPHSPRELYTQKEIYRKRPTKRFNRKKTFTWPFPTHQRDLYTQKETCEKRPVEKDLPGET